MLITGFFPFRKGNTKNLGITAIGRLLCHWSAGVNIFSATYDYAEQLRA